MDIETKRAMRKENAYERMINRRRAKYMKTKQYGLSLIKEAARVDTWSSKLENGFFFSIPPAETPAHRDKKYERYVYWREKGASVFVELRLINCRPDLIICMPDGEVFVEEILNTEEDENIIKKSKKYPFPIFPVYV